MKVEAEVKAEAGKAENKKFCDEVPVFDEVGREGMGREESGKGVGLVRLVEEVMCVVGLSGWMGVREFAGLGKTSC